eukprot:TRINITY_DN669_c0_g1_i2.p1 TRINITY_DN669_c0_g1~~TRINITY_DN669_c0_g1_i2.p1  ORF type:complete len:124 (+),score=18.47 TRINITY_DN669_c0_g1_i2:105-476(+)
MSKLKAYELRKKKKAELLKMLGERKAELATLRVAQVTGGAPSRISKIRVVRKDIARILTVISQSTKAQLKSYYAGKKYKPLDLRPKLTRALRKALKPSQANKKTHREMKAIAHNPRRLYALKF